MSTSETRLKRGAVHPVQVHVDPAIEGRNRLTTAFRPILALPHLLLVGGPIAATLSWTWRAEGGPSYGWGAGGGVLGAVAAVCAVIAWFAIVFTGHHPQGLWDLAAFYLRWRVRAVAYVALLRDEYPPFGDGSYRATLELTPPSTPRDRVTVAFRIFLAIPHLIVVWALGIAWAVTTVIAWFAILITGRFPEGSIALAWECSSGTSESRRTCCCSMIGTRRSRLGEERAAERGVCWEGRKGDGVVRGERRLRRNALIETRAPLLRGARFADRSVGIRDSSRQAIF